MDLESGTRANNGLPRPLPRTRFASDMIIVLFLGIGTEFIARYIGPYQRGFFCNDESIRYPYKSSSVPLSMLLFYICTVTIVPVILVEFYRLHKASTVEEMLSVYEENRTHAGRLFVRTAMYFGYSFAILCFVAFLTTATKYPVGRLRPHFIDVCRPDIGYDKCDQLHYITNYTCTTNDARASVEARLSFFSGHASSSTAAATFVVMYLQNRLAGEVKSRVLVPTIQTTVYASALYIAYTRIADNWHHWSDVFVGILVGTVLSVVLCSYVVGLKPRIQFVTEESVSLISNQERPLSSCLWCKRSSAHMSSKSLYDCVSENS